MLSRKRGATSPDATEADALTLSAEEAEAEAAEAEAAAVAARARARAIKLRREAEEAAKAEPAVGGSTEDGSSAVELTESATEVDATEVDATEVDATEVDATEIDVAEPDEPQSSARSGRLPGLAKVAAVVLAVVAIAGLAAFSGFIVWQHRAADHQRQLDADFSAAARQGVVSLMSLNFTSAGADVQRILDNSTGQFREDFASQAEEFTKVAESSKVVTEATVSATAVQSKTEDTADVLVAANSTITNAQGAKENPRNWRLIVSVARDGDQIKMAKVEFAP
ncbi:hypothetical protein [Mycobacterium sp. C31M]